jgi:hypothetical protein
MEEKGYVRVEDKNDPGNISFKRTFDEADNHARLDFLETHLTNTQQGQIERAIAERDRLWNELEPALRGEGANGTITMSLGEMLEARAQNPRWQTFGEATMAVRVLYDEFAEYHVFQEQWDAWQAGSPAEDNWFVQAEADFAESATEIAEQLEEIRLNFHNQFNTDGMDGFRSVLEQSRSGNNESPFWDWLLQLRVFGVTSYHNGD